MASPENTVESADTVFTPPCDHSFAYSTLEESVSDDAISIEKMGSTRDGAMFLEVSFACPRCGSSIKVELVESVITTLE